MNAATPINSYSWSNPVLKVKAEVEISVFDDGNDQPCYLITMNGRQWKVSETIYYILFSMDGKRTVEELQGFLHDRFSLRISKQKLEQVIELTLVRNGILEGTIATTEPPHNKMMWGKFTLLRPSVIAKLKIFIFLFHKKTLMGLSSLAVIWLAYILFAYSNTQVISSMFSLDIKDIALCVFFIFATGLIHEFGHSIAAMSYGVAPGRIGVGVYFVMPVMFSDVTRIWRIKRHQRVIVDLGGMYLQCVFLMLSFLFNALFLHSHLLNIAILLSGFTILGNFNPFIKFDGYWVLVDYLGITEVKTVIYQLWANLFYKVLGRPAVPVLLSTGKKVIMYIYSLLTVCFFASFIRFLVESWILAFHNLRDDITALLKLTPSQVNISFAEAVRYLSDRITTYIALFFFLNLVWRYVLRKVLLQFKKKRARVPEEVRCAAD